MPVDVPVNLKPGIVMLPPNVFPPMGLYSSSLMVSSPSRLTV